MRRDALEMIVHTAAGQHPPCVRPTGDREAHGLRNAKLQLVQEAGLSIAMRVRI